MKPMSANYNQHSKFQNNMAAKGIPFLKAALETTNFKNNTDKTPYVIADYGSATGTNSYQPVHTIVTHLHQFQPERDVLVTHVDLPNTDWTKLFTSISKDKYVLPDDAQDKVFTSVVGRSFYEQVLPRESVDFGISTSAVHWMSKLPCKLSNTIFITRTIVTKEEREIFTKQAKSDWARFLSLREKELKKGGKLFIVLPIVSEEDVNGEESDLAQTVDKFLFDEVEAGNLTAEERGELTMPLYMRTIKELETDVPESLTIETRSAPFRLGPEQIQQLLVGQKLDVEGTEEEKKKKMKEVMTRAITNIWFAVVEEYYKSKLIGSGRTEDYTSKFIQKFKNELSSRLAQLQEINNGKGAAFGAIVFKKKD
eukprot:TRINITY_DN16667_c0_g1_i1.p1 TRINITY_DN16667_c0_g1~~TRINITY_DN16667_c0_g1_i1.p1  ORF type:complete len:368 (-),score=93.59 TRINITY_DN16667_c0_g1_i1:118-1221(-)